MNETNMNSSIDEMLADAKKSVGNEALAILWKATLDLKQWHFITKYKEDVLESSPFVGVIDNRPWVFVFTDRHKAQQYCVQAGNDGFADPNGTVYIISMDTANAINYVTDLQSKGVYGMRINEGNGWFSPIANLPAIIEHTKKLN